MLVLYIFNVSFWVCVSILTCKILNLSKLKVANGTAVDISKITWCHNGAGGSDIADRTNCRDSFDKLSVSVVSGQNPLPFASATNLCEIYISAEGSGCFPSLIFGLHQKPAGK